MFFSIFFIFSSCQYIYIYICVCVCVCVCVYVYIYKGDSFKFRELFNAEVIFVESNGTI